MPTSITFFASIIEIATIYGIMLLLDHDNRMPPHKVAIYIASIGAIATLLDYFHVLFHFVFMSLACLILLKVLLKQKKLVLLSLDVIIAFGSYVFLQFIASVVIGNRYGNILENYFLLFVMLFLFAGIVGFLIMNKGISASIERLYTGNRDIVVWVAVNLFFTILIVLHIWNDIEHFFWKEQWALLPLVFVNYGLNFVLFFHLLRRKQQKNKMQAYQEYGEYLEEMMHQLSSRQHEFVNQISVIMGLAQTKEGQELTNAVMQYCEGILDDKKRSEKTIISDDSMITAMLYQKRTQAEKEKIQFEYLIGEPFQKGSLSPHELVELIVNLINNAFEAVSTMPIEERQVFLKMNKNSIEMINSVSQDFDESSIIKFSQIGYSTKGSQRGYGISNIKTIVDKYHGQFDIYMQDQMIVFSILFP